MNTDYLFAYIASTLNTSIRLFLKNGILSKSFGEQNTFPAEEPITTLLKTADHDFPKLTSIGNSFFYATIILPETMSVSILLLGPICIYTSYTLKHNLITDSFFEKPSIVPSTIRSFDDFIQHVLLLHNLFSSSPITKDDLIYYNCNDYRVSEVETSYSKLIFQHQEENLRHNSWKQEQCMLSAVENGDLELLENTVSRDTPELMGTLASETDRNYKNISISVITLLSRAAIRGGVNPELAFCLCDSYIMEIESLKSLEKLNPLVQSAKVRFTSMVREIKSKRKENGIVQCHPLLEQSKDYIFSHLHEKISLQDIANYLHISTSYLSVLFRKYEGVSFSDFVMREKVSLAKNMLIYSPYSYIEIAAYLGFCSQSHLGKQFKAITGMTLKQFRDTYAVNDFSSPFS